MAARRIWVVEPSSITRLRSEKGVSGEREGQKGARTLAYPSPLDVVGAKMVDG